MNERIREIRNDLRMTQADFGEAIGKTKSVVANYEIGRGAVDDSVILLIESKYHYRAEWIRTGELPKKLPEPDADGIARIGFGAAYLDAEQIRKKVKEKIDRLPAPYLKLLAEIWQSEEFRSIWDD